MSTMVRWLGRTAQLLEYPVRVYDYLSENQSTRNTDRYWSSVAIDEQFLT